MRAAKTATAYLPMRACARVCVCKMFTPTTFPKFSRIRLTSTGQLIQAIYGRGRPIAKMCNTQSRGAKPLAGSTPTDPSALSPGRML